METSVLVNALTLIIALVILTLFAAIIGFAFYAFLASNQRTGSKAIQVKKGNDDLAGVPFFVKNSRWLQETTYLQTLVTCSLGAIEIKLDDEGKQVSTSTLYAASRITPWSQTTANNLQQIQMAIAQAEKLTDPDEQFELWQEKIVMKFESLAVYEGELPTAVSSKNGDAASPGKGLSLPLIGNTVKEEVFVDYGAQHTINYPQPLVGSANVSVDLTADGTLGKATAEIKDDTLGTILSALPVQDAFSSALTPAVAPAAEEDDEGAMVFGVETEPAEERKYRFDLSCKQQYIKHIYFRWVADNSFHTPIKPGEDAWYRQEFVADLKPVEKSDDDKGETESDKKKPNSSAVK